jgi:DNA-binding SARP family transcriptional activator
VIKAYLFGPLRLEDGKNRPISLPTTSHGRTLLAWLLLHAGQWQGRSALATLLAPEESEEKGRRILSRALWEVRQVLPDAAIVASGDRVQLQGGAVWRDCARFDQLAAAALNASGITPAAAADLAEAVALYSADLLSDFYDDALWLPREQRRERYLRALELLAAREKQHQRFAHALDYILTLASADPLRESAHREALRLYVALNRPQAARHHYEQFCRTLAQELGVPPEPATRELAETILANAAIPAENPPWLPTSTPPVAWALQDARRMPLIGRESERAEILLHLRQLGRGEGGVLFLSGPSGVGKSRLLEETARDAEWRGIAVARATGRELQRPTPYALFTEAVAGLLTPLRWQQLATLLDPWWLELLGPLFPDLAPSAESAAPTSPDHDRLEAIVRLVLTLGKLSPLLLILDDVQWADSASLHTLVYLSQRLRDQPVLVLLAFRSGEARHNEAVREVLETLDAGGVRLHLRLEPLTPAATDALIARGLGLTHAAPRFSARLHHETGGMPLLLLESLRTLHDEGVLHRDQQGLWHTPWDEGADYEALHLPSAEKLLQRRLRQLPPVARHTLELAAVMGQELHFGRLLALSEHPRAEVLAALGLLVQRQFLHETPQTYRFSHDNIRQTLYDQLPPIPRRRLHRQLAALVVQEEPGNAALAGHHYERGEQWAEALQFSVAAADQARDLGAIPAALAGYETALHILERHAPLERESADLLHFRLLAARQPLLLLTGQTEQQGIELEALQAAADRNPDPAARIEGWLHQATLAATVHARHEEAITLARQALAQATRHALIKPQATAWQTIGYSRYVQGQLQESISALRQAVTLWQAVPDSRDDLMNATLKLIYSERAAGNTEAGLAEVARLLTLAEEANHPLRQATAWAAQANFYSDQGEHLAAIEGNTRALEIFRRLGVRLNEARALGNLGYSHWALRDYGRAIALTEESLAIFEEAGTQKDLLLSWMNLAELYYDAGQLARGEEYSEMGVALAQGLGLTNYELMLQIGRIRALLAAEKVAEGEQLLATIAPRMAQEEEWGIRAGVAACQGLLALLQDRPQAALAAFGEAVTGYEQGGNHDLVLAMQSHQAYALWLAGDQAGAAALSAGAIGALEQLPGGEFVAEMYWHHSQITGEPGTGTRWLGRAHETVLAHAQSLPESADRARFLERPLHRAIVRAWEGGQPRRVWVWLPPKGETTVGRKSADNRIEISWTPWHPEDDALPDKVSRRHHQLRRLMAEANAQGAQPIIPALAEALDSTIPTIKRDLATLRR